MPTLRDRQKEETRARILAAAVELLAEQGPAGLTVREVARKVGIAVSGIYRYAAGRDELITELVVLAYRAHATAVDESISAVLDEHPQAYRNALRDGLRAYRRWGKSEPALFGLIYGQPIPTYVAPQRTLEVGYLLTERLLSVLVAAHADGQLVPAGLAEREASLPAEMRAALHAYATERNTNLPAPVLALALAAMWEIQGFTAEDVFGQSAALLGDAADVAFEDLLERRLQQLGISDAST